MMTYYPIILVLILAILDWIAVEKKIRVMEYIAKPATMLAILLWIGLSTGFGGAMLWFTLGVVLCLAGDVFLMLPWDLFIFGLLAFLLGQVFFVFGFNTASAYLNLWGVFLIILLGVYIGWLYGILSKNLEEHGRRKLKTPVLVYSLVISAMVYSAWMTFYRPGWSVAAAISAGVGALLFYFSDSVLAWDRFVKPISHGRLINMIIYHLGVIGIVLGAVLYTG
jgi:uncharacterized membrane protein YhhN